MTEEKAQEKAPEIAAQAPQTPAAPQAAPATATATATAPAPAAPAVVVKKEKPANCAACNKSIRKKRWYYRNGKYFCTKRCWHSTAKKDEAPKEAAQPAA
jgi:hypothetical protein